VKANRKAREKAVSGVFATVLVLPILIAIISALYMLTGSLIDKTQIPQNQTELIVEKLQNSDIVNKILEDQYFWKDSFEGNQTQWHNITGPQSNTKISTEHYWKQGKSLQITTAAGETCGIKKPFSWRAYKQIETEISFTIDLNEKYKNLSISLGNYTNNANISINITDENIAYQKENGDYQTFANDIPLHPDQHCWHNIKLTIDYEKAEYKTLTLNEKKYDLQGILLNKPKPKTGHERINVQYTNYATQQATSNVDDFIIKEINKMEDYSVTTDTTPVNIPPSVDFTIPADGALNVPIDQDITVVFTKTMDTNIEPNLNQLAGTSSVTYTFDRWETTNVEDDTAVWTHDNWDGSSSSTDFINHNIDIRGTPHVDTAVYSIDINNDNNIDIVANDGEDDTLLWYENVNGDGSSWTKHVVFSGPANKVERIFAGDIDGDNHIDIVSSSKDDLTIRWHENINGDGSSWTDIIIDNNAKNTNEISIADMDNDNDVDVIAANTGNTEIVWYENVNGDGSSWTKHIIETGISVDSLFVVDFDFDGVMDLIYDDGSAGNINWYENVNGDGSSWIPHYIGSGAFMDIHAADIGNDNDMDVIYSYDTHVRWYENDGTGSFNQHTITTDSSACYFMSPKADDLDGDGDIDIIAANYCDGIILWFENDGTGSFTEKTVHDCEIGPWSLFIEDINGDGNLDIQSGIISENSIWWYENNGGGNGDDITLRVSDYYDPEGSTGSDYDWSFTTL